MNPNWTWRNTSSVRLHTNAATKATDVTRRKRWRLLGAIAVITTLTTNPWARAGCIDETFDLGGDAGDSLLTAHVLPNLIVVIGFGGGGQICGSTQGEANPVDMYRLTILSPGPVDFRASTSLSFGGFATFDTQLWLFDAAGHGLIGNDDSPFGGFQSLIDTDLAEGGSFFLDPGVYYLAVSGFGNEPVSAGGLIFNQQTFTQVSIADGPGGGLPLSGWTGGGSHGSYTIDIVMHVVPGPGTLALILLGLGASVRRRRP